MGEKARAHVLVTGRVQGVFFRMETKSTADKAGVYGWVRNKKDGSVEALFEGEKQRVAAVLEWCKKGPPLATVSSVDIQWEEFKEEYTDFQIIF